jgi:hypothetical protein
MGGTCAVREEPGKQKPRSCRAQELARGGAQEKERQRKEGYLSSVRFGMRSRVATLFRGEVLTAEIERRTVTS